MIYDSIEREEFLFFVGSWKQYLKLNNSDGALILPSSLHKFSVLRLFKAILSTLESNLEPLEQKVAR